MNAQLEVPSKKPSRRRVVETGRVGMLTLTVKGKEHKVEVVHVGPGFKFQIDEKGPWMTCHGHPIDVPQCPGVAPCAAEIAILYGPRPPQGGWTQWYERGPYGRR